VSVVALIENEPAYGFSRANPGIFVVMGVSGCGKSTVGARLAQTLGVAFLEGDSLHPASNVARMAAGLALGDADREGWLRALAEHIRLARQGGHGLVLSCSALKRSYRDILRSGAPGLQFIHLHGAHDVLAARMAARTGHYMPPSLLTSQLDTLEMPGADEHAQGFDVAEAPDTIVGYVVAGRSGTNHQPALLKS
jgi:gluconokinase